MPDVKLSQLAAASAASVAAGAGLWTMAGHILGLRMEYVGPASIRVSSGSAWIPSLQQAIEVPAALTLSGLTLAANTWYHLYLYLNGSTPAIEAVTDVPAAPYSGTARTKAGAASRRYIGSFRTNAAGQIIRFVHGTGSNAIKYMQDINTAPLYVLNGGTAVTSTDVSCSAAVPVTSRIMYAFAENNSTAETAVAFIANSEAGPASSTVILEFLRVGRIMFGEMILDATQRFNYSRSGPVADGGLAVWCTGYLYER
ncbi:hypothetical protein D7Y57_06180 [Stenotrophomonas maltophilia]|uniref:hypothetical protein n=1 Tax=Stenotrophomonas TaxID=40323 RepID=UPI00044CC717|nr:MULTISPECIES: hypothetical protein [Stenotrophomonas]KDE89352.1 hypothetical protein DF40_004960 [Stenotrophomonas maltophilia M30]MBA0455729.1 hypothetical protein [Stenotrophomonas maltophilia]MBH1551057.1 hypothetical protein [Stenotrophomonas maltophilia]MBH1577353.1 hypothetical protein [Stenotrophomonas maltophilia]MBH1586894.1 hypothetical protein [Stenotrophomonas maltophilia]